MQHANATTDLPFASDAINDAPEGADDGRTIEGGITEVKPLDHSLAVLNPDLFAKTLFEPDFEKLGALKRSSARAKVDIKTKPGMAKAEEFETAFVKVRTGGDKKKTEFKKPLDQAGKKILEQFNALAAAAKVEEAKWTAIITAEKTRLADLEAERQRLERVRIEGIENRIYDLRQIPSTLAKADAATIEAKLNELVARALLPEDFQEHLELAIGAQNTAINELRQLLTETRAAEAQAAELARLRKEEQERKEAAAAAQHKADTAAAALKVQQDQMGAIMEVQGLANTLTAAGQAGDREAIEAALAKVEAFNPADYGTMAPMASLARDAVRPLLVDLLANLPAEMPAPAIVTDLAAPGADDTITVDIEADHTGVVIGQAVLATEAVEQLAESTPGKLADLSVFVGAGGGSGRPLGVGGGAGISSRPEAMAIVRHLALRYGVNGLKVLDWIDAMDTKALRAELGGA